MKIKELRDLLKLTQQEFAEKYGIPKRSIENWEGEKRTAPGYVVALLNRVVKEDAMERDRELGLCLDTVNMQFYTAQSGVAVDMPDSYKARVQELMDAGATEEQLRKVEAEAEQDEEIWAAIKEAMEAE